MEKIDYFSLINNSLSTRIRKLRKAAHLTQLELANRIEVTKDTISKWERLDFNIRRINRGKLIEVFEIPKDFEFLIFQNEQLPSTVPALHTLQIAEQSLVEFMGIDDLIKIAPFPKLMRLMRSDLYFHKNDKVSFLKHTLANTVKGFFDPTVCSNRDQYQKMEYRLDQLERKIAAPLLSKGIQIKTYFLIASYISLIAVFIWLSSVLGYLPTICAAIAVSIIAICYIVMYYCLYRIGKLDMLWKKFFELKNTDLIM